MIQSENRICQNCKSPFVVESEDFQFYKKIDVPAPTFCPECRRQRRMSFRNERVLYKRPCNAPGHTEEIVSTFSPDKQVMIYDEKYWWSDAWNPLTYGTTYNFSIPFFEQYKQLFRRIPLIGLSVTNMVGCAYCNVSEGDKDCFMINASERNEGVLYSNRVAFCKDSADLYIGTSNELCYEVVASDKCYRVLFSQKCTQCTESSFLYNCSNCDHCFGCINLKNKSYYFLNEALTKEEYERKIEEFSHGSFDATMRAENLFRGALSRNIHRFAHIIKSVDCTGDNILHAKNCKLSFDVIANPSAEDCKFIHWAGWFAKDMYDGGPGAGGNLEIAYEITDTGIQSNHIFFTSVVYGSYNVRYSINCHGSHHLFGCYGMRNKSYCILNRQYTKEDYEILVPKIIQHMKDLPYVDVKGRVYRYGEFFPFELSPYAYNEVIAQEYFPLSKDEAIAAGYKWKDVDEKKHIPTILSENVPDTINQINDSIVNEIISCGHGGKCIGQCITAFKILPRELEFYRRMNIPLPRLCPNCRHEERLKKRNSLKLWHRQCMCNQQITNHQQQTTRYQNTVVHEHGNKPCPNEFETSYAPERSETVYCESCYQKEVV